MKGKKYTEKQWNRMIHHWILSFSALCWQDTFWLTQTLWCQLLDVNQLIHSLIVHGQYDQYHDNIMGLWLCLSMCRYIQKIQVIIGFHTLWDTFKPLLVYVIYLDLWDRFSRWDRWCSYPFGYFQWGGSRGWWNRRRNINANTIKSFKLNIIAGPCICNWKLQDPYC